MNFLRRVCATISCCTTGFKPADPSHPGPTSRSSALPCFAWLMCIAFMLTVPTGHLQADEKLKGIACRSVHFGYPGQDAQLFYNQITVQKSAPGTYFCVIGWNKGYFGIQQLADDRRVAIFSVWDSGDNDPNALPNDQRTQVLYVDPEVTVKRFGGEGSGGQSFLPFQWKEGQTYKFAVVSRQLGNRTAYSGWLVDPETNQWRHLITFSTITGGKPMNGFYSFVEDFKRDRKSTQFTRSAVFSGMYRSTEQGKEELQTKARFTGDSNPVENIDAQVVDGGIQLSTGGDLKNEHVKLNQVFDFETALPQQRETDELIKRSQQEAQTPQERKEASHQTMTKKTIPFLDRLAPLPALQQMVRPSSTDVAKRLTIELALALKADGAKDEVLQPLLSAVDRNRLSDEEREFLSATKTNVNDEILYLWHAERAMVLAWSLGWVKELPWATKTTEPMKLYQLVKEHLLAGETWPVPLSQIADHADLTYRMHWSVLNAKYMDRDAPDHLQVDVLQERHYALAWLLGLQSLEHQVEQAVDWHEVQPQVSHIREFASPVQ